MLQLRALRQLRQAQRPPVPLEQLEVRLLLPQLPDDDASATQLPRDRMLRSPARSNEVNSVQEGLRLQGRLTFFTSW
ncbi:MAG: hypothetical protein ACK5X3_00270 [Pseudomonadota bacterium]